MDQDYEKIINYVKISGKRLKERAGKIADIGISKTDLTEEDLKVERGLKDIVADFGKEHAVYAEEENDSFPDKENIWVCDPISQTNTFIRGLPHFSIVVAHVKNRETRFACVLDVMMDEVYTAYLGKGSFMNGHRISVQMPPESPKRVVFNLSTAWKDETAARKMFFELSQFRLFRNSNSSSVNGCYIASGKYNGCVNFTKDIFPDVASALIVREAGGLYTTPDGRTEFLPTDRVFIGGDPETYRQLLTLTKGILGNA